MNIKNTKIKGKVVVCGIKLLNLLNFFFFSYHSLFHLAWPNPWKLFTSTSLKWENNLLSLDRLVRNEQLNWKVLTVHVGYSLMPQTSKNQTYFFSLILQETAKLSNVFEQVAPDLVKFDSPCEVMKGLAEVVKVSDVEFIGLELHRLLRR